MSIPRVVLLLLKVTWVAVMAVGTAPGDEEDLCADLRSDGVVPIPSYSPTTRILMDSWNYQNLLSRMGAVWIQVDNDVNNPSDTTTNVSFLIVHLQVFKADS